MTKKASNPTKASVIDAGKLTAAQQRKLSKYIAAKRLLHRLKRGIASLKDEVTGIVEAHGGKVLLDGAELSMVETELWSYPSLAREIRELEILKQEARDVDAAESHTIRALRMRDTAAEDEAE